jgi:hypothetical protein
MAASEAVSLGYGGISQIRLASGLSRKTIANGIREIAEGTALPAHSPAGSGPEEHYRDRSQTAGLVGAPD